MTGIILQRDYPLPGGRTTLSTTLTTTFHLPILTTRTGTTPAMIALPTMKRGTLSKLREYYSTSEHYLSEHPSSFLFGIGQSSYGGALHSQKTGIPLIVNLSDTNYRAALDRKAPFLPTLITKYYEKRILSTATIITVPSLTAQRQLEQDYPHTVGNVRVIPEAPLPLTTKKRTPEKPTLLFPRATDRKNITLFLQTLPYLHQYRVIILGSKEELPPHLTHHAEHHPDTHFTGVLTPRQRQDLYARVDLLVYLPTTEAHSYTVLEALHAKLPILATRTGWLSEEFGTEGHYLDHTIPEALTTAIAEFYANKETIQDNYERIHQRLAKTYNYYEMLKSYARLFNEVTEMSKSPPR